MNHQEIQTTEQRDASAATLSIQDTVYRQVTKAVHKPVTCTKVCKKLACHSTYYSPIRTCCGTLPCKVHWYLRTLCELQACVFRV